MQAGHAAAYGLVEDAAIAVEDGRIAWIGPRAQFPPGLEERCAMRHDARGALVTPGLIDCHTHLVYAGDRAHEFELRLQGASYEEIARAGGGIASTVRATRAASGQELVRQSLPRLQALVAEGVTTLEIKSGYGLSLEHEGKMLRAARALGARGGVEVRTTFLGAHALPPEYAGRADDYVDEVVRMLPLLHGEGLVDAVDAFCERIAFSTAQTERVFQAARKLGLPMKLHAEQLSDSGGAQLAARYGALSCDHLEWLGAEGAQAMAGAGSVAVLLPGAFYFLRETRVPPVELLRQHRVPIAVSTDCNPGSSPCTSLLLMLNMACTLFRLTPEESLAGVTRHAAQALGLHDRGVLAAGARADFVLWDVERPAQLAYAIGANPRIQTVFEGRPL
ncbi:imidazolonepropionase [Caenimonas aquaedulcis]|nr:imidazolonepropionase [Caenimonas aquaedulcis]